jgi:hypothetical protein
MIATGAGEGTLDSSREPRGIDRKGRHSQTFCGILIIFNPRMHLRRGYSCGCYPRRQADEALRRDRGPLFGSDQEP